MTSLTSSSQGLAPKKKILTDSDTLRCWDVSQTKQIAKHIQNSITSDSLIEALEQDNGELERAVNTSREQTAAYEAKIQALEGAVMHGDSIMVKKDEIIEVKDIQLRKQKRKSFFLIVGMALEAATIVRLVFL